MKIFNCHHHPWVIFPHPSTSVCGAGSEFDPADIVDDNNAPIGVVKNPPRPTD
jgi:hypothetical protein